jgi:hypothetical protein
MLISLSVRGKLLGIALVGALLTLAVVPRASSGFAR